MRVVAFGLLFLIAACSGATPQAEGAPADETVASANDGVFADGFIPSRIDNTGAVFMRFPAPGDDGVVLRVIHTAGVTAGLGSNPVGLDRGAGDDGRIIAFRRLGDRLVIEQENWRYRAGADNPLEKKAVRDSFAASILWAGPIEEGENGAFAADISGFLKSDVLDLRGWLKNAGQGDFSIADDRTIIDPASLLVFPENVEMDVVTTLASERPGSEVRATAAEGRAVTLTVHHSFVKLPPPGFEPRPYDPRTGAIDVAFYDFSAPLTDTIVQKYARRFRLERQDPATSSGPVKKPIVFYVDAGAPQAIRDALIEGASWWAEAFEEAGFEDAFRVEVLPDDVHPFDARYNVIQWVHRQTRGWSYGGGVVDPRTGEMIKARVILGSQRVRQDRMIFEGLLGADASGAGGPNDPVEIALQRIRQLSAHEVGHPLGFEHNFAASTYGGRASVMDYPAPLATVTADGAVDLSNAYGDGVGAWDRFAVKWLYTEFPDGVDEAAALDEMVRVAHQAGLKFVADTEGRSVGTGEPAGSVWDNGADPVAALADTMAVRIAALRNFGPRVIGADEPLERLRTVIVPIYLYHRYQVAAAAKLVGGYSFDYAVRDDGRSGGTPVPFARQQAALEALLTTLDPSVLDLPNAVLDQLTPAVSSFASFSNGGETFGDNTGAMFDLLSAADAAGALTINALLHPHRLARLVEGERRGGDVLTVGDVLAAIETTVFADASGREAEIQRTLQTRFVSTVIELAGGAAAGGESRATATVSFGGAGAASPTVQARLHAYLSGLRHRLSPGLLSLGQSTGVGADRAHRAWLAGEIERFLERPAPAAAVQVDAPTIPAGSPIGGAGYETCWHCE